MEFIEEDFGNFVKYTLFQIIKETCFKWYRQINLTEQEKPKLKTTNPKFDKLTLIIFATFSQTSTQICFTVKQTTTQYLYNSKTR